MSGVPTVEELQAQLAERNQEIARLRAEPAARMAADRRTEEQFQLSERRAQDLIRYAPTGIYELDLRTGRFRTVNDAMCGILGYTREELLATSAFDLLDGEGGALFADRIHRTLAGERVDPSVEYRVKRRDGTIIYCVLDIQITYHDGQPDGAFVIAHDVTERRQAAEELRRQREQIVALADRLAAEQRLLTGIIENIPAQIAYLDENLVYRLCNRAAASEMGLTVEQVLGRHFRETNPASPQLWDAVEGVLRTGEPFRSEELVVRWPDRPEEGPQYYKVAYVPNKDADGNVRGIFAEGQRVTALVEARQRLQEAKDELEARVAERTAGLARANEALRYQATVLANVSDAVIATDQARRIRYLNPAAERQSGWLAEEAVGHNPVHLFRAEFLHGTDEDFALAVETEGRWQGEVVVHRRDGTSFPADATAETLRDEDGNLLGHIGVYHDITERKRLEEALRAGQEQARSYSRRLVAAIEDERRNLARELHDRAGQSLWALKLTLAYLQRQVDPDGAQASRWEEIGQLIAAMMDDLHGLATNLRPVSLDRLGLVPALQQHVESFCAQSKVEVSLVTRGLEGKRLPADLETALYRVVQEALTNVSRHARARHVEVALEWRNQQVVVRIEDDGHGFDLDEALHSNRLGLLGMRERAEMLGGQLAVETAPERGTTIRMVLPLREG